MAKWPFSKRAASAASPPTSAVVQWFATVKFLLLLGGVAQLLWLADTLPLPIAFIGLAVLTVGLWSLGALLQGRLGLAETLMVDTAVLAMSTSAWGWVEWHRLFKPMPLLIALFLVAKNGVNIAGKQKKDLVLMGALAASLAGDCFLMFPGFFIPGLVSFLVAHLFYIARFKQGVPWLASHWGWLVPMGYAAGMFSLLWQRGLRAAEIDLEGRKLPEYLAARERAVAQGLHVSENGIKDDNTGKTEFFATEQESMAWITEQRNKLLP